MSNATNLDENGLAIPRQNLGALEPNIEDDGRLFNHDGSSELDIGTTTTTTKGYYQWDHGAGHWQPMSYTGAQTTFLSITGDTMEGDLSLGGNLLQSVASLHGVNGQALSLDSDTRISQWVAGTKVLELLSTGNVAVPSGDVMIQGQTAWHAGNFDPTTKSDTTHNHDADYAAAGHNHDSAYVDVTGDTMSGALTLSDASPAASQSWVEANLAQRRAVPLSITHADWADGLANEEIWRLDVPTGKQLEVRALDLQLKGGGSLATPSNMTVDVYDETSATVIASDSADGLSTDGSPVGTSGSGAAVIIRLSNSTGSVQTASITGSFYLI